MRVIQAWANSVEYHTVGQTFLVPSIIEDTDGVRYFVNLPEQGPLSEAMSSAILGAGAEFWVILHPHFVEGGPWSSSRRQTFDHWPTLPDLMGEEIPQVRSGFVHLHAHSEYSALDGYSRVEEMVHTVHEHGDTALGLTDHGICAGHPELQSIVNSDDHPTLKPIFGVEAYLVNDRFERPPKKPTKTMFNKMTQECGSCRGTGVIPLREGVDPTKCLACRGKGSVNIGDEVYEWEVARWQEEAKAANDYYHLILWAQNEQGLRNIWAMTTVANREGFHRHPRLDWEVLETHSDGVMASTACLRGPLIHPLEVAEDDSLAIANLARLQAIFPDRLWVEIHTNQMEKQKEANRFAIDAARTHGLPLIAVSDSHYPCQDDQYAHAVWIAMQTNSDVSDDQSDLFAGSHEYHLLSEEEVRKNLSYLDPATVDEAVRQTTVVADLCDVAIEFKSRPPIFSKRGDTDEDRIGDDERRLRQLCEDNWGRVASKGRQDEYRERFEYEMGVLVEKGFCGYFMMTADIVGWAKDQGIMVGPGRGSGGGSLVGYLSRITEVDPIRYDLMFERFINPGRDSLPDFDLDFPASKRDVVTQYVIERYGEHHVLRVGSHTRLRNKGVLENLLRTLRPTLEAEGHTTVFTDGVAISKIIDAAEAHTAGKGLKWGELFDHAGEDLERYVEKYPKVFDLASQMVGRLKNYGRHAAGLIISPDATLDDWLPAWYSKDEQTISEFDYRVLEAMGLVKFDLLTLRTIDTLQECIDLIKERTGETIQPYDWEDEYDDPDVWAMIGEGRTLGLFQLETPGGTRLAKRIQPEGVLQLSDLNALNRPGPQRSGIADAYIARKAGVERVAYDDEALEGPLGPTFGCMVYQEQIMATVQVIGGYDLAQADTARRIIGKKLTDQVEEEGKRFVKLGMEKGYSRAFLETMWEKIKEFAKYGFNKSHSLAYSLIGFWAAWLKYHYPLEFYAACLSTYPKDSIPDFVIEAQSRGYRVLGPDINDSGHGFSVSGGAVRYGLDSIKGVGPAAARAIREAQPYTSYDDFLDRKGPACNSGHVDLLVSLGAFDSIEPNRAALEARIRWEREMGGKCVSWDEGWDNLAGGPKNCSYDWDQEPVEIGKSGRPKKRKDPPKKCTKACRRYEPLSRPNFDSVQPYSEVELRSREREHLGVWLSSTPFDDLSDIILSDCSKASEIEDSEDEFFVIAATIHEVKAWRDRSGRDMAFIKFMAQDGIVDTVCFSSLWDVIQPDCKQDRLVIARIQRSDRDGGRGYVLKDLFSPPVFQEEPDV